MINELIKSKNSKIKPKWFLRQSGRHIKEYFTIRNRHKNFIEFCLDETSIVEATILPLKYYNIDAAILFSDILILPHCLGQEITFKKGVGPLLEKIEIKVPLVIRLAGTNVDKGNKILRESKIKYIEANSLEDAANKAVKILK